MYPRIFFQIKTDRLNSFLFKYLHNNQQNGFTIIYSTEMDSPTPIFLSVWVVLHTHLHTCAFIAVAGFPSEVYGSKNTWIFDDTHARLIFRKSNQLICLTTFCKSSYYHRPPQTLVSAYFVLIWWGKVLSSGFYFACTRLLIKESIFRWILASSLTCLLKSIANFFIIFQL